ncbi:putative lipoprotein [Archangium gephyra]|uniref:Lipoprotein n=1 Tax=Archangium gephyra TaxID=48 RepID=A0AAC8TDG0_9BACT|nr:putative lipoprotein [Archangium gephyra]
MDPQEAGTLQLPLSTPGADGKVYRLVGATFHITGTQTVTVSDTAADTVQTTLQAGSYTIELASGWTMERADAPGVAVPATLRSPNPLPFFVKKNETTQVRFLFKLPGEGTADVGIHVDSGGWFAGTLRFDVLDGDFGPMNPYSGLVGTSVPFVLSFESFTVTHDSWDKTTHMETGPATLQFGGAPSEQLERVAASLKGRPFFFSLRLDSSGKAFLMGSSLYNPESSLQFEILSSFESFTAVLDSDGYPVFSPIAFEAGARIRDPYYGVWALADVDASP